MVNKELGNTATCIKEYAGNDLDTSNISCRCLVKCENVKRPRSEAEVAEE